LASRAQVSLARQQDAFDGKLAQHLSFIDRLLADKQALAAQLEAATAAATAAAAESERQREAAERAHAAELQRAKEAWAAAEKVSGRVRCPACASHQQRPLCRRLPPPR
jgi:hypothetical protein